MSSAAIFYLQSAIGLAFCGFALWKGGPPERFGAAIIVGIAVILRIVCALAPDSLDPILQLTSDGLTAVGLLAVALLYGSLWIGGAMLLYAAQFTLLSYYFVTERPHDWFHGVVNNVDFIGVILCLALGTCVSWRQRVMAKRRAEATAAAAATASPPA
jgi:hypothetical protein